jgi:hypothetical protein
LRSAGVEWRSGAHLGGGYDPLDFDEPRRLKYPREPFELGSVPDLVDSMGAPMKDLVEERRRRLQYAYEVLVLAMRKGITAIEAEKLIAGELSDCAAASSRWPTEVVPVSGAFAPSGYLAPVRISVRPSPIRYSASPSVLS